jgi:hypothetical protein
MVSYAVKVPLPHLHHQLHAATHILYFSINNWLAFGIGFAFAGSIVLARALITSPREYAARVIRSGNNNAIQNVSYAENKADAQVGIAALVVGFAIQGFVTVLMTGHASALSGGWSYLVTAGWIALPVILVWLVDDKTRWNRTRRYLIELARYERYRELRQPAADINELKIYGRILKEGREARPDETDEDYAKRVWNAGEIRSH